MAGDRTGTIPEPELRTVRDILYRQRATDLDSLQKQMKGLGAALLDALAKSASALEEALQDTRGHLKVAVETLMEQAVEVETLKLKVGKGSSTDTEAWAPRIARLEARLEAAERSLAAVEQAAGQLSVTAGRIEQQSESAVGELVERMAEHLYLLSRGAARRTARERAARARALARVAEAVAEGFVTRVVALRREVGGDVAAYDGLRGLEARGRETSDDLRREAQRLAQRATAEAAALNGAPADLAGRLDACRDLLALGALDETGDDLDYELRRVVSQWLLPLIDLAVEYREATDGVAREAFVAALAELAAAARPLDLEILAPAPGAPVDPATCEVEGAPPEGSARVARLLAPGYCLGGTLLRRAKVAAE